MSNIVDISKDTWQVIKEQAEAVKKAGLLPSNMTAEQAAIIVMKGRELGIPTMRALEGMYVVNGKVAMDAKLIMGLIRERCPQAKITVKRKDAKGCIIEATRPGQEPESFQFLEEDAKRAGLLKPNSPWEKYPVSMYWARVVTGMGRQLFSDILGSSYTPEELGGEVDEEVNEAEIKEAKPNVSANSSRASALNARLVNAPTVHTGPQGNNNKTSNEPTWDQFKEKKFNEAKPIQVNQETGEVSGYPEMPKYEEFTEPTPPINNTHWSFVASAGKYAGKTMRQIHDEIGTEGMMKMYQVSLKKVNDFASRGEEIPDTVKETLAAMELCLQ